MNKSKLLLVSLFAIATTHNLQAYNFAAGFVALLLGSAQEQAIIPQHRYNNDDALNSPKADQLRAFTTDTKLTTFSLRGSDDQIKLLANKNSLQAASENDENDENDNCSHGEGCGH